MSSEIQAHDILDEIDIDPTIEATANSANQSAPQSYATPAQADAHPSPSAASSNKPAAGGSPAAGSEFDVDLSVKAFAPLAKIYLDQPAHYFDNPNYYKTAIAGEGQASNRLHAVLSKYLSCQDPKDKLVFRQQVIMAYWELVRSLAPKAGAKDLPLPKQMLLRFGVILPSLFRQEHRELFSKTILENITGEPVFYLDEWLRGIAQGRLSLSATDEAKQPKKTGEEGAQQEQIRLQQLQSKNSGKLQSAENALTTLEQQRSMNEIELKRMVDELCEHETMTGMEKHKSALTESQRKLMTDILGRLKVLSKIDKDLVRALNEVADARDVYNSVEEKIALGPKITSAAAGDIEQEFETVRQMAKMTCGRQGNQFPIFTRDFYHCLPQATGFRENIIQILSWIETIDPGAFVRIHKNTPNRIVPFVLLLPTYGDFGFCWEPFDRYNRVTSRGRIVVPMYPRDLKTAVLMAVADLRWQVAKEKASFYWMEEGLTGQYYEWIIEKQKLKGDLKQFFIQDYILWMTKESEGVQRLDKEVRGIFWRNIPFPQSLKDTLKTRSLVYDDLCKKDMNRARSDGY